MAAVSLVLVPFAVPAYADVEVVGGGAFGESVDITLLGGIDVSSGPAPAVTLPVEGGGPFSDSLASIDVPGDGLVLTTGLLQVDTEGGALGTHGGFATSSSQVDALDLLSGILTAGSVISECTSSGDGSTASTTIVNGQIPLLGLTLDASPAPNSTIAVSPTITVTLNEQSEVNVVGDETSVVVNAIHVTVNSDLVFGSGDIVIAQSSCSAQGPDVLKSPPVAVDDVASTPEDTPTTVPVLDNDSDPDGDELTVTDATDPANGSVVVNGDGTITYTPDPGFSGEDTFTYTVCDPDGLCDTATVTVTVTAVDDPPVVVPRLPATGRTLGLPLVLGAFLLLTGGLLLIGTKPRTHVTRPSTLRDWWSSLMNL